MTATLHTLTPAERPVRTELAAMRSIAETLEGLPDNEARARVLRWAAEYFRVDQPERSSPPAPAAGLPAPRHADSDLAVAELSSYFEPRPEPVNAAEEFGEPEPKPDTAPAKEPDRGVLSMVHNFVAEFQKLARDWQE
jgi:hypothetical protein